MPTVMRNGVTVTAIGDVKIIALGILEPLGQPDWGALLCDSLERQYGAGQGESPKHVSL
jgi:ABC-type antimicrobial peptide transport system permease subunit